MISKRLHPASFSNVNSQLAQITPNGAVMTNLVTNGDFSNGTPGWVGSNGTLSSAINTLSSTGNGSSQLVSAYQITQTPLSVGRKIYCRAKIRVTNSNSQFLYLRLRDGVGVLQGDFTNQSLPVINQWYNPSGVLTVSGTPTGNAMVSIQHLYADAATANGNVMEVQYVLALDLTAIFGAGNEPTAAQMDELLAFYDNSWFNGNANITDLLQYVVSRKANIAQEAWITPTLLNSWANNYVGDSPAGYFKDSLGIVHLRGCVKVGVSDTIFILPSGYRPAKTLRQPAVTNLSTPQNIIVDMNSYYGYGYVVSSTTSAGYICLDGITFKAEA